MLEKAYLPPLATTGCCRSKIPSSKCLVAIPRGEYSSIKRLFGRVIACSTSAAVTGTLAMLIKRLHPDVDVVGLDPNPKAPARAKRKAERSAVSIRLDQGFSHELPYPEASFDRVFSTFMFHYLMGDEGEKTFYEVRRVLTPGGSLHMLDFMGTDASSHGPLARYFHSSHRLKDNTEERILTLMNRAGFISCEKVTEGAMLFGSLRIAYHASAPMSEGHTASEPSLPKGARAMKLLDSKHACPMRHPRRPPQHSARLRRS